MPDLVADQRAAFREAMARAEEKSGIVRDDNGVETNGIESILRGETPDVQVELQQDASAQLDPDPAASADTSGQEVGAAEPTVAELQAQLAAAEARLAEKDSFIGRQSSEVGELRHAVDEMRSQLATVAAQPVRSATPITQELIDERPDLATQAAYEQRDERTLQVAFDAWKMVDSDTAHAWLFDRKLEVHKKEFEDRLAEERKLREEASAPIMQRTEQAEEERAWFTAFDEVRKTHPDFMDSATRLLQEVAPQHEYLLPGLQSPDAATKANALKALYAVDKMSDPESLRKQLEDAAKEAAAESDAARAAAGVVTGQNSSGESTETKTTEELEAEAYIQRQKAKPSLARGWTGR